MAQIQGQTILFISRNDIIKRSSFGGNIDPERIVPYIYLSQAKFIQPLLGSVLYYKLQDDINAGTLTGAYKTLVDNYITDALVWYTCQEALPFLAYHIDNAGITKSIPEGTEAISRTEIDFLLQKALQSAQFFSERLMEYLIANNTLYPEYLQTTGKSDMQYPNKNSQFNPGWNLY